MPRGPALALSFGKAVGEYERGRPGYPDGAVDWILGHARRDPGRAVRALDVGAGTGKLTAALVARGLEVTAVEPIPEMRERLASNLPTVRALPGTAESLGLPDASADLVAFAQAWHWVDVPAASAEVARVLAPGGILALVWNIRDSSVEWVARLGEIMGSSAAEGYDSGAPRLDPPLAAVAFREFPWTNRLGREELLDMVASRSYVIAMAAAERDALLGRVAELLDTHPELSGRTEYAMPYVARATIARAAPAA